MVAGVSWTLYQATRSEAESSRLVIHTLQVLQAIAETNEALSRSESAQRGYLLTATGPFLAERDEALRAVGQRIARIRELTSDNASQQQRIDVLGKLIVERIELMRVNSALRETAGLEAVRERAASGVGQRASARIYRETGAMRDEELRLLELRRLDAEQRRNTSLMVLGIALLVTLLVLIPGYVGLALQSRVREQTERNLKLLADALPGAMYQLRHDVDGKPNLIYLSAGVSKLCGLPRSAYPDWDSVMNRIDSRDREAFVDAVDEARKNVTPLRHDYRVRHVDGTTRWMHHEASMLREPDGSVLANGYVADVTQQHELKNALVDAGAAADAANRAKSTFLATMSHEIRTPMNAVLGMLELLSITRLDAEQRSTLSVVQQSGKSLLRIIDDVLDFSKIEAGRLDVRPEPVSISEVIDDVYNVYSGNASSKGLWIGRRSDPAISPALMVDALRLRQILSNFVSNAIKFTMSGSVDIDAQLIARANGCDHVRFSVKDTGPGISEADQQRLFEPFSQGTRVTNGTTGGTGLGLTISRRLSEMMGGKVELQSELGKGTTLLLDLTLPIADPAARPKAGAAARRIVASVPQRRRVAPSIAEAEREGTLVLLVDDHPTNRMLLERQVQTLGYAAESAENGVEALEKWRSGRYALVITDCNMPEMDGYTLARKIRDIEAETGDGRTPIIACTANALDGEAENCLAAGMDDYVVKPAALAQLLVKIERWLPLPEADAPPSTDGETEVSQTQADELPIDRSVLAALTGADPNAERAVLDNFRRVNDDDAALLARAVAAHSIGDVGHAAHRIKGACRMVGAHSLAAVCEVIERASRADEWRSVESNMDAFDRERARLNRWIDTLSVGERASVA